MAILAASPEGAETFTTTAGLLRLRTLVRLRWLAVFGQSLAVLGVHFILDFPLPLGACLGIIALSAWLNIFLTLALAFQFTACANPGRLASRL